MSSIGSDVWRSHSTKTVSTTAATANAPSVIGAVHPLSGASMSPYTSDEMPTIDRSAPTGSSAASCGSRDLGTRNQPPMNATVMIGRLMRNTEPNQKWVSRKPLMTGPSEPAKPVVAAQIAIAFARSCGGNTLTRIDNVDGMISAAPAPITHRQMMTCVVSVACDARSAPTK